MPTDLAAMDTGDDSGGRAGTLATTTPSGPPTPPSGPSWLDTFLQSDTMQRLQAVARSQIAAAMTGAAWALSRLPEGQRQLLAADMARDFAHIQTICTTVAQLNSKSTREEIAKALDELGYVAERLIAYYTKYVGLLGAPVPRLTISAMSTEDRGALRRMAQDVGDANTAKQATERAQKTNDDLEAILDRLAGRSGRDKEQEVDQAAKTDQTAKVAIGADEMTYALAKLAALAESMNQFLRAIYGQLKSQPRTMPQKTVARLKRVVPRKNKKQPGK